MAAGLKGLYGLMLGWVAAANSNIAVVHYIPIYVVGPRKSYSVEGPVTEYRVIGPAKRLDT